MRPTIVLGGDYMVPDAAPLPLALLHQIGAVVLVTLIIRARHHARFPVETSLKGGLR